MTASNITDAMDSLGTALATIAGLRVFDFAPKSAQPPFAFVDFPESVEFDLAMRSGGDRTTVQVVVAVADVVDRACRDQLAAYAAGSGTKSVRAAINAATVGQSVRVMRCEFRPVVLAAGQYSGAIFDVDVIL